MDIAPPGFDLRTVASMIKGKTSRSVPRCPIAHVPTTALPEDDHGGARERRRPTRNAPAGDAQHDHSCPRRRAGPRGVPFARSTGWASSSCVRSIKTCRIVVAARMPALRRFATVAWGRRTLRRVATTAWIPPRPYARAATRTASNQPRPFRRRSRGRHEARGSQMARNETPRRGGQRRGASRRRDGRRRAPRARRSAWRHQKFCRYGAAATARLQIRHGRRRRSGRVSRRLVLYAAGYGFTTRPACCARPSAVRGYVSAATTAASSSMRARRRAHSHQCRFRRTCGRRS